MPHFFSSLTLRDLTLHNRIVMAPMCTFSAAANGRAADWHLAHYLARSVSGTGLLITEATAVEPRGRISQRDPGLWDDAQIEPLARIVRLVQAEGAASTRLAPPITSSAKTHRQPWALAQGRSACPWASSMSGI
jgi:NADPH2 dehydrogenase